MAANPKYISKSRIGTVRISAANPSRTGSGTLSNVITAGGDDTKLDDVVVQATGSTTDGMVRLFLVGTVTTTGVTTGPGGVSTPTTTTATTTSLFAEIPVKATVPSAKVPAFSTSLKSAAGSPGAAAVLPFTLPTGFSLKASTEKGESFDVIAFAGDF